MIIIKLQGGLGNQLFQYNFGRLLEIKYSKEVAYDLSFYNNSGAYTARSFLLDVFRTKIKIANDEEVAVTKYPYGLFSKILLIGKKVINKFFLKRYQVAYDEKLLLSLEHIETAYCEGFWQSYKYVNPVIDEIKKEIILKNGFSDAGEKYKNQIVSTFSVAVHIRRGDYVTSGKDLEVVGKEYYEKAINFFLKNNQKSFFYIFSDDIAWVKNELGYLFTDVVYVSDSSLKDYEELVLISLCKNIITANSSFSWWGAMLSSKEGIITTPNDWKNVYFKGDDNLCPKEWVRF